jgi:hypothetical protein
LTFCPEGEELLHLICFLDMVLAFESGRFFLCKEVAIVSGSEYFFVASLFIKSLEDDLVDSLHRLRVVSSIEETA